MRAFIECESKSRIKNRYDEKTFRLRSSFEVSAEYPFPYGFIPSTSDEKNDSLDCFVVTERRLKQGEAVDCETLCTLEFFEGAELDYKVVLRLSDEDVPVTGQVITTIKDFIASIFAQLPEVRISFGSVLDKGETDMLIARRRKP